MSLDERIASRVESMHEEILTTSSQLIQIESVNPHYPGTTYEDVVGGEGDAARFMAKISGSILQAHTANEWVDTEEIIAATKTFALAALDWCGEG